MLGVTIKPSEEDRLPPVHVVVTLPNPVRLLQPERLSPNISRPVPIRGDPQDKVSVHTLQSSNILTTDKDLRYTTVKYSLVCFI